ncbi:MAG: hypothetical protein R3345_00585 [Fulvivirga sp.]|nr:hypothetical protein [Fulvivirga sp.]
MISKLEATVTKPKYLLPTIFLLIFIVSIPVVLKDSGYLNAYVLLSKSLLEGTVSLTDVQRFGGMDLIYYNEHYYLPYPPLPAIILMPVVGLFGSSYIPSSLIAVLVALLSLHLLYRILNKINMTPVKTFWLLLGFSLGSPFWFVLTTSNYHYGFAQVLACFFCILFIYEYYHQKRVGLLALYIGLGFLCRQTILFYGFFFLFTCLEQPASYSFNLKKIVTFSLVLIPFGAIMAYYNYIRFGNPFSSGYEYINYIEPLASRVEQHGVFSWHYVPFNFYTTFIKGHNLIFGGSDLLQLKGVDLFGTSLTVASPFIFFSLKAKASRRYVLAVILSILPILLIHLFYHNNGFHQVNTSRFALDYFPLLFLLIALGAKHIHISVIRALITYSIALTAFSFAVYQIYQ